ncbi:MAG: carboxylating nicotinate-nucleotide diphosphorylase [Chthoniobacterales bacterium]|nr:carboxylating nicotinate-nucleotide diphosphorylase [Chthoniobacterales bacterium]
MNPSTLALIKTALAEDIATGDITSMAFIPEAMRSHGRIITRHPAVIAGLAVAIEVFRQVDSNNEVTLCAAEGEGLEAGAPLLEVSGPTRSLLTAERVVLNFLGRLTGIASLTRRYVDAVVGTGVLILDTRKMTPGWRILEKEAVKAGGGKNHRQGLFDAILVKDNHLVALGPEGLSRLPQVLQKIRADHPTLKIEIEADTLEQVSFFLEQREVNTILLDNMSLEQLRTAVALRQQKNRNVRLEASGGITLEKIRAVAETGIDEISLGALTHSAVWADLSMEFEYTFVG